MMPAHRMEVRCLSKSPTNLPFLAKQATGGTLNEPVLPERLSASVQKLQSILGRSPGFENELTFSFTVARPRGIHTRFPILPVALGHPDTSN
jgi:hypothetical protein